MRGSGGHFSCFPPFLLSVFLSISYFSPVFYVSFPGRVAFLDSGARSLSFRCHDPVIYHRSAGGTSFVVDIVVSGAVVLFSERSYRCVSNLSFFSFFIFLFWRRFVFCPTIWGGGGSTW